ncbi:hypothetical protein L1987_18652 [Smallanthus sonchifolius]|uniref:Uncharacterized protein n=1 Tax=Smallanthus sonchifolius TaxID=185202 RepID=A0ACB9J1D6_9ASTR|nr:hypothetical protein L1987_18652 [Smallanthus sonchifolius]
MSAPKPHSRTIEMMEKKVDTSLGMKFLELGDIPLMQEVVSVVRYPQGTPLWRNGPPDKPVLCNACWPRLRTKGSLVNYTPLHA